MADEDLKAELERLKADNERLNSYRGRNVSLKVSEKGGVSVYGLGRFPVTLGFSKPVENHADAVAVGSFFNMWSIAQTGRLRSGQKVLHHERLEHRGAHRGCHTK
jgi:hypothetical protein